jgi:hypothetical protein
MGEQHKIFADQGEPAILHYGAGSLACNTLQEATLKWNRLSAEQKLIATIVLDNRSVFGPNEIDRLCDRGQE